MERRYNELDSLRGLRGLASLSVFSGHVILIFNPSLVMNILFEFGPLRVLKPDGEAVTLFFVLSGFVLATPFFTKGNVHYWDYIIRRICRIYIPYITAILIAIAVKGLFYKGNVNGLSIWFNVNWSQTVSLQTVIDHLLLIDTFTSNLNNVVWTLVHEMRISFIFPFMIAVIVRINNKQVIGLGISLSILSVLYYLFIQPSFNGTELYVTLHFCGVFIIGTLLARNKEYLTNSYLKLNIKYRWFLFLSAIILYLYIHPSFVIKLIDHNITPYYRTVIDTWFEAIGAAVLILIAIASGIVSKILRNKFINYVGRISYSLYLSHLIVLLSCVHFFTKIMPISVIILIAILATFIVSNIMYYLVEKPSIKLGKFLVKSISRKKEKTIQPVKVG